MRLRGLITRARYRDEHMRSNFLGYVKLARDMGIRLVRDFDSPAYDPSFCRSLFAAAETRVPG